jgi:hypothetical protein
MDAGTAAGSAIQSGSSLSTLASVSDTDSPANACLRLNISYSTAPNDQMSERRSATLPLACSGDMYAAVPKIIPLSVPLNIVGELESAIFAGAFSSAFAKPKSSTLTLLSDVIFTLAGFKSRWMIPFS